MLSEWVTLLVLVIPFVANNETILFYVKIVIALGDTTGYIST